MSRLASILFAVSLAVPAISQAATVSFLGSWLDITFEETGGVTVLFDDELGLGTMEITGDILGIGPLQPIALSVTPPDSNGDATIAAFNDVLFANGAIASNGNALLSGFATAGLEGAVAVVSFEMVGQITATRISLAYTLFGDNGAGVPLPYAVGRISASNAIPLPATAWFMLSALCTLLLRRKRL